MRRRSLGVASVATALAVGAAPFVVSTAPSAVGSTSTLNMIANPGFENGTAAWTTNAKLWRTTARHSGAYAGGLSRAAKGPARAFSAPKSMSPGNLYTAGAWVAGTPGLVVSLNIRATGGSTVASRTTTYRLPDSGWHHLTVKYYADMWRTGVLSAGAPVLTSSQRVRVDDVTMTTSRPSPLSLIGPYGDTGAIRPPSKGVWWGAFSRHTGNPVADLNALESSAGRAMDTTMRYHDFLSTGRGVFPDSTDAALAKGLNGSKKHLLIITWLSAKGPSLVSWHSIASGAYDGLIRANAIRVKNFGRPVFISFDSEADRYVGRKGTPSDYVAAYRRIHNIFASVGANNVSWVWTMTRTLNSGGDARHLNMYPGSSYVDWVGFDLYNRAAKGCSSFASWASFWSALANYYYFAVAHWGNKPIMIPEYGTTYDSSNGTRSEQWYTTMPATLQYFPGVRSMTRWDVGSSTCNLALNNGPGMVSAWSRTGRATFFNQPTP